jgi:type IV fimbrial biogenesis protein FimT
MKNSNSTSAHGFTLLELITVIAIIGITLALGVPSLQSIIVDSRLSSSANAMLSALQLARSEAAKRVRFCGIAVSGNTWSVFVDSENNVAQRYAAATGVTLSGVSEAIVFRPEGRLNSSSPIVMTFTASGHSSQRTLTITPSGKTTITNP